MNELISLLMSYLNRITAKTFPVTTPGEDPGLNGYIKVKEHYLLFLNYALI